MIEIGRVLCPIDFSDTSRHALEYAVVLARWYGSRVTVLHACAVPAAVPVAPYGGPAGIEPAVLSVPRRAQVQQELERFVQPFLDPQVRVDLRLGDGLPIEEILRASTECQPDLIVLGTHGRSGFERLLLGSVTERVLRKAPCPVLTVPPRAADIRPPAFGRILCAVDFSPSSLRGLEYALSLAQESDASLVVLNVLELLTDLEHYEVPGFNFTDYAASVIRETRDRLTASIPAAAREYCEITELVLTGKPHREILALARENQMDLVVMGVRGRGVADLAIFGSTTQQVVRAAPCPVLTIRSDDV